MFRLKSENATAPVKRSFGYDLFASENVDLNPGEYKNVSTDVIFEKGYPHISAFSNLAVSNGIGVLAFEMKPSLQIVLINHDKSKTFHVQKGDAIAHMVFDSCEEEESASDDLEKDARKWLDQADHTADVNEKVLLREKACEVLLKVGNTALAARNLKWLAEHYEKEGNQVNALKYYQKASESYRKENSNTLGNQCILKVAELETEKKDWSQAMTLYESVGKECLGSTLLKWSAKMHFFNAVLCMMCLSDQDVYAKIREYETLDSGFEDSRESQFLRNIFNAVKNRDKDELVSVIYEYDSISPLKKSQVAILLEIKTRL
jgi:dUTPase